MPNLRRMRSAQRGAGGRGGRPSRPQGGSGAGSVALASLESTRSPAVGASVVLASPQSVVFPKPTTSDRHPSTWLGMALSIAEGPRRPWSHPSTVLGVP